MGNLEDRKRGIDLDSLPRTFRDTIVATRRLGYRYCWIDSLCILQDSHQDWVHEASLMHQYYKHAVLSIAADSASGDHEGFLGTIRPPITPKIKVPFHSRHVEGPSHAFVTSGTLSSFQVEQKSAVGATFLSARGWCMQEDILAPRTLHYTTNQLVWECQRHIMSETDCTPQGTNDSALAVSTKRYFLRPESGRSDPLILAAPLFYEYCEPMYRWYVILAEYFRRKLTVVTDRLPAISGLAHEIEQQSKMEYKAGIWIQDLHLSLLWSVDGRGLPHAQFQAPSWSWAALNIQMSWGLATNPEFQLYRGPSYWDIDHEYYKATLVECRMLYHSGDLVAGHLRLCGRLLPYNRWKGTSRPYINTFWRQVVSHQGWPEFIYPDNGDQLICSFDMLPVDDDDEDHTGMENEAEEAQAGSSDLSSDESNASCLSIDMEDDDDDDDEDAADRDEADWWGKSFYENLQLFQIARYKPRQEFTEMDQRSPPPPFIYALLLQPSETHKGCFRRVGLAEVPDGQGLTDVGWEETEVTIV
ncbi:hypothetical protein MMC11_008720 [Xylographa trunciseda]|nr:hypothetical protein [Xylographa trunciseda]